MKNNILIFLVVFLSLFSMACSDNGKDDFLEEFDTIMYFLNSGELCTTFYDTGDRTVYELTINKAGSNNAAVASVDIAVMSSEELAQYNEAYRTDYKAFPEECFVCETGRLDFAASESYKKVSVVLETAKMKEVLADGEGKYVIPLQLCNGTDSINSLKKFAFIRPTIETPTVGFEEGDFVNKSLADDDNKKETVIVNLVLPLENVWDLQCDLRVDEAALDEYNQDNGTNYQLLPSSFYQLTETVSFEKGVKTAPVEITVDKSGLDYGTYVLPLTVEHVSKEEFVPDAEKKTLLLGISFVPPVINLTPAMLSTNALEPSEGSLANLLDGNITTYFHSAWSMSIVEEHYVQVALKEGVQNFVFSYTNRDVNGNAAMAEFYVSVSEDGKVFKELERFTVSEDSLPTGKAESWTSPTIRCDKPYEYIRFTNVVNASGKKYFVWSEFSLFGK